MKKLSERLAMLEEMGFDTSKYNVVINGNEVEITGIAKQVVEDKQVDNKKLFRRWITAQTFKMLYEPSYNFKTRKHEIGWDNFLRNRFDYKYQFTMMLEELRVLSKLEKKDKEEFAERSNFFNKNVVVATCEHYMVQLDKYVMTHMDSKKKTVRLAKYGTVGADGYADIITTLKWTIRDIESAKNYNDLYVYLKRFIDKMNKIPSDTPKCSEWKIAFKGSGAYYSLKNMILFHNCVLRGCENKHDSFAKLRSCLVTYKGDYWKFHAMLKDTIEFNNFDLRKSIESK